MAGHLRMAGDHREVEGPQEEEGMTVRLTQLRRVLRRPRFKTTRLVWCLEADGRKGTSNGGVIYKRDVNFPE
ncbi:unnamed protein product [Ixodes pacificus]